MTQKYIITLIGRGGPLDLLETEGEDLAHELANKLLSEWTALSDGDKITIEYVD